MIITLITIPIIVVCVYFTYKQVKKNIKLRDLMIEDLEKKKKRQTKEA